MKNELVHLRQFETILKNYRISQASKDLLSKVSIVLFVAPSAAGRNTIIKELVMSGKYHYIVSDTTRKPRVNNNVAERNGVEYWFKTEEELLSGLKSGNYLEAAIIHNQQVSGMSINEIKKAEIEHKTAVTDIEVQGVSTVLAAKPDSYVVFVLPPSFEAWIDRFENRGELPADEKLRRLNSALVEFNVALNSPKYLFLINDELTVFIEKLNHIIEDGIIDQAEQEKGRMLAKELQKDAKKYLEKIATGTLD